MQLIRRLRIPAVFCALAVLFCELISQPYTTMGISDDGPYILVARNLAATGHIHYNGWSAAMLCWQLYLGAALIKVFGFSFTTVRMSTLLMSLATAFLLQRTVVRCGISERNAVIGTLALVLSPLYLLLSATFMSDIHGLFAIVLCLYACLRALRASTDRAALGWLCFAVAANAVIGTSRQLAWLGVLVMVPSTLWLLRARRRVLFGGIAAAAGGILFILGCMLWLKHQPYTLAEHLLGSKGRMVYIVHQFLRFVLDLPFLLIPIAALFLVTIRKSRASVIALVCGMLGLFFSLACYPSPVRVNFRSFLDPALGDWVTVAGGYGGGQTVFLGLGVRLLLTALSLGGLFGVMVLLVRTYGKPPVKQACPGASWKELGMLLAPFTVAYMVLLVSRAISVAQLFDTVILDRYALGLLVVALIGLVRYYQERVNPELPFASILLVGIMAVYGVAITHNTFSYYRARVAMAAELRAADIPETAVDNGWEYNMLVELQHARYINDPEIENPPGAYVAAPPPPAGHCPTFWYDRTPHIQAVYGVSSDPSECFGLAPFVPVKYSRWLASQPGTLYVVNYLPRPVQ